MEEREKKRLNTRSKSDKEKKAIAKEIIQNYANTTKSWLVLCKEAGISISTLWGWVSKYGLEREKAAATEIANTGIVKYGTHEGKEIPIQESIDGGYIPLEDSGEYQLKAFAIQRVCMRYGMGEGDTIGQLQEEEGVSRKVFLRYIQNFPKLGAMYNQAQTARTQLMKISFKEAQIAIAEGLIKSLVKAVHPIEHVRNTTVTREVVIGQDDDGNDITAEEVVKKVQKETKLPTAQILALAAKALGWISSEDQILDGSDYIGDYSNVEIINNRAEDTEKLQKLLEERRQRRIAKLGPIVTKEEPGQ